MNTRDAHTQRLQSWICSRWFKKRFETTRHFKRTTRDSWALHFRLLISTIYCKLPFYNVESSRNTYSRLDITIILFHTHFRMKNTSQLRTSILALLATRILSKHLLSSDQQAKGTYTHSLSTNQTTQRARPEDSRVHTFMLIIVRDAINNTISCAEKDERNHPLIFQCRWRPPEQQKNSL
jgi:hypothetical protein